MRSAPSTFGPYARPKLRENRTILHFDYDCFYASVFEAENPALRSLPLAVQQKQIIVTCNYEARRRGLYKLQLVTEARKLCPNVVIVLGENLDRFRRASKELALYLTSFIWSQRAEHLGFDELWLDITDMIDYNVELLNQNGLSQSFFHLDRNDPTVGFPYDASLISGHTFPPTDESCSESLLLALSSDLDQSGVTRLRLAVASHLASFLRRNLEEHKGYSATVGISVNKLLSKLVGNANKPRAQTTLLPSYNVDFDDQDSNVNVFLDKHDIGKIPGIGCKLSQKLREHFLGRKALMHDGLVFGRSAENITVRDIRLQPGIGASTLDEVLGGPGSQKGTGANVWDLLHGVDKSEVGKTKAVPTQISIEDSYLRLDTMEELTNQLLKLSARLIKRLRLDLTEGGLLEEHEEHSPPGQQQLSWIAFPQTVRLSTRPRPPINPDGSRSRSFNRISRSDKMPTFVLAGGEFDAIAARLTSETLLPMFRKLHPERHGWDLTLVNIAAVNMHETAGKSANSLGRDIGAMFSLPKKDRFAEPDLYSTVKDETGTAVAKEARVEEVDNGDFDHFHPQHANGHKHDNTTNENSSLTLSPTPNGSNNPFPSKSTSQAPGSEDSLPPSQPSHSLSQQQFSRWESDECEYDEDDSSGEQGVILGQECRVCGALMPSFALEAHSRFHGEVDLVGG